MNDRSVHPIFSDRPAPGAKLWRYLDIGKFIALLETSSIHFTRIDKFDDHFEGAWPESDKEHFDGLQKVYEALGGSFPDIRQDTDRLKPKAAVSCWVGSEYESVAMWRLYASTDQGVAITTSFQKLEGIVKTIKIPGCDLGDVARVKYFDHSKDGIIADGKQFNILWPYMHKNRSYIHENEVRALLFADLKHECDPDGVDIQIDLPSFTDEIIINPFAKDWFCSAVRGLLKKYGLEGKYRESSLSKRRFYLADGEPEKK